MCFYPPYLTIVKSESYLPEVTMTQEKAKEKYDELFATEADKAAAFDKIAKRFYFANFATMSKSDFETLLFSLYLDQILNRSEDNYDAYSDYTLSKVLGIPQSRISALKVRKELQYPYSKFDWKESFKRISQRAIYEDGKIRLYIPDRNLYLEIKNAVETSGGYVEMQLSPNLLQIRPEYFIDLVLAISDDDDRKKIRKEIKKEVERKNKDINFIEGRTIGRQIGSLALEIIPVLGDIPDISLFVRSLLKILSEIIKKRS